MNSGLADVIMYIFVILLIVYIAYYITNPLRDTKDVQPLKKMLEFPIKGSGKNMINCPYGCQRGTCIHKGVHLRPHMCSFDFQCQMCNDRKTGMFYKDGDYEYDKAIEPKYGNVTKPDEIDMLNKDIANNNNYINKLNESIMKMNHDNSFNHVRNQTRLVRR